MSSTTITTVKTRQLLLFAMVVIAVQLFGGTALAGTVLTTTVSDDDKTFVVEDAPDQDIVSFGKNVEIKKSAKTVLAVGGDVIVEGSVKGDVAALGGNIVQKEQAYIGGHVVLIGGTYKHDAQEPLREPGTQTVMIDAFGDQLRNAGQHPSQILSPTFSVGFLAQRLIVALIWFVITLVFTTIAPGAVGRAVARISLSSLKIVALGAGILVIGFVLCIASVATLPGYLWGTLVVMCMILLILSYTFGKVSLQVSTGKLIQKYLLSEANRSETLATLFGVIVWTTLLSLPYVWLIALFSVFTFGIGLILTGKTSPKWQNL
ncbi:MAG: hypothetical protein ACJ73D_03090 [Pyrinomonadaceae bacterium]